MIDYYSGILYPKRNRVVTLDETLKTRIHVGLYYFQLNRRQTLDIFHVIIWGLQDIKKEKSKLNAELDADDPMPYRLIIDLTSILNYATWHFEIHRGTPKRGCNGGQFEMFSITPIPFPGSAYRTSYRALS